MGSANENEASIAFRKLREDVGLDNWSKFASELHSHVPAAPAEKEFGFGHAFSAQFGPGGSIFIKVKK